MRNVRGQNSSNKIRIGPRITVAESVTDGNQAESHSGPDSPLTLHEEAELDQIFGEYHEFVSSIGRPRSTTFDPCRAVLPLREALKTANLLVDCIRQSHLPDDGGSRGDLREQVLDCEEKAADLIGRLSRLRRGLNKGRAAAAS